MNSTKNCDLTEIFPSNIAGRRKQKKEKKSMSKTTIQNQKSQQTGDRALSVVESTL